MKYKTIVSFFLCLIVSFGCRLEVELNDDDDDDDNDH